jgi:O-antigen ligase
VGWHGFRTFRTGSVMLWSAAFYGWHMVGMLWTSNAGAGWFDLEVKASLLLFPVLYWLWPKGYVLDHVSALRMFTWANVLSVALCLGAALFRFGEELQLREQGLLPADPAYTNHFFESRFSLFLHPSYMAMYLCFALAVWVIDGHWRTRSLFVNALVVGALFLGVLLCNSKMGLLTAGVMVLHMAYLHRHEAKLRRPIMITLIAGAVVFGGLAATLPNLRNKIIQAFDATGRIDPGSDQSSQLRRMAWDSALELFRGAPFMGTGTGDVKDELIRTYAAKGYVHAEAKRMNAHGQFLQSAAALGIIGLVLVVGLVVTLVRSRAKMGVLGLVLGYLVLLNWAVESMAEVQAGVVFLCCLSWVLLVRTERPEVRSSPS